jgi:hypothetical protein
MACIKAWLRARRKRENDKDRADVISALQASIIVEQEKLQVIGCEMNRTWLLFKQKPGDRSRSSDFLKYEDRYKATQVYIENSCVKLAALEKMQRLSERGLDARIQKHLSDGSQTIGEMVNMLDDTSESLDIIHNEGNEEVLNLNGGIDRHEALNERLLADQLGYGPDLGAAVEGMDITPTAIDPPVEMNMDNVHQPDNVGE